MEAKHRDKPATAASPPHATATKRAKKSGTSPVDVEFDAVVGGYSNPGLQSIRNDPIANESRRQLFQDPSFRQMIQQAKYLLCPSFVHQFDDQAYLSAVNKFLSNNELLAKANRVRDAYIEGSSKPVDTLKQGKDELGGKIISNDVELGGHAAEFRYLTDKKTLLKLVEIMRANINGDNTTFDEKSGTAEAGKLGDDDLPILHHYANVGDFEGLKKALESGADKNKLDKWGGTALYPAIAHGEEKSVKILLEHGFAVDVVSNEGNTPLHYAAYYGWEVNVESLLKYDAHVTLSIKNKAGNTPIDVAKITEGSIILEMMDVHETNASA